ncbi:MAG: hypothetical protein D6725_09555 [Planctomycetota bacterium]|nr:MAG: hypothetical protein D6725_09555 [Planctomycetota bacterium]
MCAIVVAAADRATPTGVSGFLGDVTSNYVAFRQLIGCSPNGGPLSDSVCQVTEARSGSRKRTPNVRARRFFVMESLGAVRRTLAGRRGRRRETVA